MITEPKICQKSSIKIEVEQGKTYLWCSCGLSNKQPFCDGAHSCTTFKPLLYTAKETEIISFCGCKYTKKAPLCDGTHKSL